MEYPSVRFYIADILGQICTLVNPPDLFFPIVVGGYHPLSCGHLGECGWQLLPEGPWPLC